MAETPITYTGPHDAVDVPLSTGRVATVKRGATVDVPAEDAKALLQQAGNWQAAKAKPVKDKE